MTDVLYVRLNVYTSKTGKTATWWVALKDGVEVPLSEVGQCIYTNADYPRTRWWEIWEIPVGVKLVRKRVTSRGEVIKKVINPEAVRVELDEIPPFGD